MDLGKIYRDREEQEREEGEGKVKAETHTGYPKARGLRISLFLHGILVTFSNIMSNIFFFNLQTLFQVKYLHM